VGQFLLAPATIRPQFADAGAQSFQVRVERRFARQRWHARDGGGMSPINDIDDRATTG
jgi:hypothetical protein